jgi:hypothetical protein
MAATTGWQARLSVRLQHYGQVVTDALSRLPGWAAIALLVIVVGLLAWRAAGQVGWLGGGEASEEEPEDEDAGRETQEAGIESKEHILEQHHA